MQTGCGILIFVRINKGGGVLRKFFIFICVFMLGWGGLTSGGITNGVSKASADDEKSARDTLAAMVKNADSQEINAAPLVPETGKIDENIKSVSSTKEAEVSEHKVLEPESAPKQEPEDLITLNFSKGADIKDVLTAFSLQTGRSVVLGPGVEGDVRLYLKDVPWSKALDVILKPYGFSYKQVGDTYVVSRMEQQAKVEAITPLVSRVFVLRYMDAFGVKDMIQALLSPRGSMSTLTASGQKGWDYGANNNDTADSGKRERKEETEKDRETQRMHSRTIIVTDTPAVVERIADLLDKVDVMPRQVLIEARFVEVSTGALRDIGVQFGTGEGGATSPEVKAGAVSQGGNLYGVGVQQNGGGAAPAAFLPSSAELKPTQPFNAGLSLLFQKLDPYQFEMLLHVLEEKASLNVLSSPRIMTLNNEAATIMVGTKYPIIKTEVSGQSGSVSTTIDYWQDIGIQLNVVPQICDDKTIRMVIHPAVTEQIGTASGRTVAGSGGGNVVPFTDYPVLSTRETETQLIINNGQTLAIGGLLKNEKQETQFKVPFLGDIPLIGALFRRKTTNVKQMDLVIFITATIVSPKENALVAEDKEVSNSGKRRVKADIKLADYAGAKMSPDLRALIDLEKLRASERKAGDGMDKLNKVEQERRWHQEEKLSEKLIMRLQKQREENTEIKKN